MSAGPSPYLRRRGHAHDRRLLAEDALRVLGEPTERVHDVKIRAKKIREQIGSPRAVADVLRLGLRMFSEELRGVDDVLRDSVPLAPARTRKRTAPIRLVRLKLQRGVERKVRVDSGTTRWFRMRQGSDRDGAVRDAAALVDGEVRIGGPGIARSRSVVRSVRCASRAGSKEMNARCSRANSCRFRRPEPSTSAAAKYRRAVDCSTPKCCAASETKVARSSVASTSPATRMNRSVHFSYSRLATVPTLSPTRCKASSCRRSGEGGSGGAAASACSGPRARVRRPFLAIDSTYYFFIFFFGGCAEGLSWFWTSRVGGRARGFAAFAERPNEGRDVPGAAVGREGRAKLREGPDRR